MRKVVFISDFFANQLVGGAELSLQTLIDVCPNEKILINSEDVDREFINANKDAFWAIGNYTNLKYTLLPDIAEKIEYAVIEFDYKFCRHRNPAMHKYVEGIECNCNKTFGKRIEDFYKSAKVVFWMSEKQLEIFITKLNGIKACNNVVLSSIFSDETLDYIKNLRNLSKGKDRSGMIVTAHKSWVKGYENTVRYCSENKIKPKIIGARAYKDLLKILSESEGLVYMPNGEDTCPRLVIEAKLLGCELVLNDFVQHKDEKWFKELNLEEMDIFLRYRKYLFLSSIKQFIDENVDKKEVSL